MADMTEAQKRAYEDALSRAKAQEQKVSETPTQRIRTAAQGLSFGTADEIEAFARSKATGRPYEEVLAEIRGGLKAYKEARPIESAAFEVGGAALPALLPGGQASLGRALGRAGIEGAAYAFGTGEGGFQERAARVPGGIAGGVGGGAVAMGATKVAGAGVSRLLDAVRRKVGKRGSSIVENEIQRLVKQTGRTPDEITQDIIDGRLLAENKTIQAAVRALRTQGGEASTILQRGLVNRPAQTRAAAMEEMKQYLGAATQDSQAAARRASEEATRAAEKAAYAGLKGKSITPDVERELKSALEVAPDAISEVNKMFRGLVAETPPASGVGPSNVTFTRPVTLDEAERVRRAISNAASAEYRAGRGGAGEVFSEAEQKLRGALDVASPELSKVRADAATIRSGREAYKSGQEALAGDVNEKIVNFNKLRSGNNADQNVAAFREGFLQSLEARAATGSRQSMIRNLTNPETKEGMLLREVFPQDQLDSVLQRLDIAAQSQEAAGKVLIGTGSQTTESAMEAARQGIGLSAADISDVLSGNPLQTAGVATKLLKKFVRTELTDAERAQIAKILVSDDPALVRNAIVDESGMARFVQSAEALGQKIKSGIRGAATMTGGQVGGNVSGGLLSQ